MTTPRPLVVDLDGTLVRTDLLWESFWSCASRSPLQVLAAPLWLAAGRPRLKQELARRSEFDAAGLPYSPEVLELIRSRKRDGGRVVLATASDASLAERVAKHLGLFDHVLASDGTRNCKGKAKAEAVRGLLGPEPFDYVGDSEADLPLVAEAARVWLVDPPGGVRRAAEQAGKLEAVFPGGGGGPGSLLRLLRPHQAAKNFLIFIPVVAGHRLGDLPTLAKAGWAFLCFSLAASAVYILNDLCDLDSDRAHDRKRRRPLASGAVSIPSATLLGIFLMAAALVLAGTALSPHFLAVLAGYLLLTTAYSFWLKRKVFVDVLLLAGLYSYRIFAGGEATDIALSKWLIVFSMFFFLCLALTKRYCELDRLTIAAEANRRRGYRVEDLDLLRTLGPVSGYLSVLVMAFYVTSEATEMYPRRGLLWLVCPILLYWITRIWFLAHRREMVDDPVVFALKDGRSLLAFVLIALVVAAASIKYF